MLDYAINVMAAEGYDVLQVDRGMALNPTIVVFERAE